MTPEGRVKAKIKEYLNGFKPKAWHYMPVQNGMGVTGIPDFLGVANGLFFGVEAKSGTNEPTARQSLIHGQILKGGGKVWVVNEANLEQWKKEFLDFAGWGD